MSASNLRNRVRSHALWVAVPLVAVWGIGTAYALWYFEMRDLRPFVAAVDGRPAPFDPESLRSALSERIHPGADATLIHLWDPDCPCNRFNAPHVRELVATYRARGVKVVAVVPPHVARPEALSDEAARLFGDGVEVTGGRGFEAVPASPAAVVADGRAQVAYFGPYSTGAVCGTGGDRFVERALDLTLEGKRLGPASLAAVGCYCGWPSD